MSKPTTVLLVGGTGRTGGRVLQQLLDRGVSVRAIVRTRAKVPPAVASHPALTLIEASLLALSDEELQEHVRGCDAVVSCLGHTISLKGIFGRPRDLVTQATMRLCRAIAALRGPAPIKFVLMSSVSVHRSRALDPRRGAFTRAFLWLLRGLVPPARDNQRAADFLREQIGPNNAAVHWVAVRPDTLMAGDVSPYAVHESFVNSLAAPGKTNMANVAHFMCELVTDATTWAAWESKMPVIVNATASTAPR